MSENATVDESENSEQPVATLDPIQQSSQQLFEIRDLLFGDQLRLVNQRVDQMEAAFQAKLQEMNNQFSAALAETRQDFTDRLDDQKQQLQNVKQELQDSDDILRSQLLQQLDQLAQQMERNHNDVMAKINSASDELTHNKADRKTLASLLSTMADSLATQE